MNDKMCGKLYELIVELFVCWANICFATMAAGLCAVATKQWSPRF